MFRALIIIIVILAVLFFFFPETFAKTQGYFANLWQNHIYPFLNNLWQKIKDPVVGEFQDRKSIAEREFEERKQELEEEAKEVIPRTTKNLWERFKELIR